MPAMRCVLLGACLLAVAWAHHPEEDFGFDSVPGEEVGELPTPAITSAPLPVQRRWGVPDSTAYVGKLFRLTIAQDAFSGDIDHSEASGKGGGPLPSWLLFHKATGFFEGVPNSRDHGENYITVRAVGPQSQDWAKDVFSIDVLVTEEHKASAAKPLNSVKHMVICAPGEDSTFLKIVMDVKYEHLKPKQRVAAIKNLSGFLALPYSLFQLVPQSSNEDVLLGDAVIMAGPGNIRKLSNKQSSVIKWQVGCAGKLVKPHSAFATRLKQQARDGTIAEVLGQPVVGWHIETRSSASQRERRETGSGNYEDYEEYEEGEEGDLDNEEEVTESVPEQRIVPTMVSPVFPEATAVHPHRHHHGEDSESGLSGSEITSTALYRLPTSPLLYGTIISTPMLIPIRPTRLLSSEMLEPSRPYNVYSEITPSATPVFITEVEPSITPEMPTDHFTEPVPTWSPGVNSSSDGNDTEDTSFGSTHTHTAHTAHTHTRTHTAHTQSTFGSTNSSPAPTSEEPSTQPPTTTERKPSTRPNEEVVIDVKNIKPHVDHHLPRKSITAGKALRFVIPENTFSDLEDGNTRNLRLMFKTPEGNSVPQNGWIQFDPVTQEVYALPLEEHVSRWDFVLEAMDKEGDVVSENLELLVQHHKNRRTVNHLFSLHLHIQNKFDFPSAVDWQLRVLDGLVRLYDDADASQITVRNITLTSDPVIFSWTNDSLPRSNCPTVEINRLRMVLHDMKGDPTPALINALSPELRVKNISYEGLGQCVATKPREPDTPLRTPHTNFSPTTRNQVDHINATVGELLVFRVPEDSFYDPEDGDTRHLKLSLLNMDRSQIVPSHWLQFDVKNQEFYGIPMKEHEGRSEYQLVCEDSVKQKAYDGLVVEVQPAPEVQYNVEFGMKLDVNFEAFSNSATLKRKFVDKLRELFGDRNTSAIALSGMKRGSTIVNWHNRSLPTDGCPDDAIIRLRRVLLRDDETIAEMVRQTFGPEFPVLSVGLTPKGSCQGQLTLQHNIEGPPYFVPPGAFPPIDEAQPPSSSDEYLPGSSDEYLLTFVVPAVIIAAMLVLAGVVACFLYRRRRSGKMSPGEDDERQAFRSKGIPVIFQDELEEKPDPENKSPVIMKEEKPPLPPPEYRREDTPPPTSAHPLLGEEDPPYQPPPPFSRDPASRQTRPKPTPTYRKPPPYVPP